MRLHSSRRLMNEINVVPYIDVMLVLLVIFMVTAPLITPGVVDVPSVGKSSVAPATPLEVIIKEDASITVRDRDPKGTVLDERRITKAELAAIVKAKQAKNADQPVVISADKNVKYEAVLEVMDELQKQAVKRVGLSVKPAQ
jgi:biopolymer transport protein TolR